jgi:hypothetical protein
MWLRARVSVAKLADLAISTQQAACMEGLESLEAMLSVLQIHCVHIVWIWLRLTDYGKEMGNLKNRDDS